MARRMAAPMTAPIISQIRAMAKSLARERAGRIFEAGSFMRSGSSASSAGLAA